MKVSSDKSQQSKAPRQADESAPTAAEELLAQAKAGGSVVTPIPVLERQAEEQRKQRDEAMSATPTDAQLRAGEGADDPMIGRASDHQHGVRPDNVVGGHVFYGHFAVVTKGEYEGRFGVYEDTVSLKDGRPDLVRFRTRDARNELLTVAYDDLAPAESRGNAPR